MFLLLSNKILLKLQGFHAGNYGVLEDSRWTCKADITIHSKRTVLDEKLYKTFWREKARAPVNVCPFRNRLFCIRSDIHCVNGDVSTLMFFIRFLVHVGN